MFYFYCLQNKQDYSLYYGYTNDLKRRCSEHGKAWQLVYYEAYRAKTDAQRRERMMKQYGQARTHFKKRAADSLKHF
ncbi:MAG: putative endonuclease [Patescibacteria group bacterium]|nr:putative endonuclease [Patescibacteria group bacterium]